MKKFMIAAVAVAAIQISAYAFRPAGWIFNDWPWVYESVSGDWYWFKPDDTQWIHGFAPADGWRVLGASGLAHGWAFYAWPYAYAQGNGAWHWINEPYTQWAVNMRTGAWTRFGKANLTAGMALVPDGTNSGIDPDYGPYSLTNADSFYMDATEITQAQWDVIYQWAVVNGYTFYNAGSAKTANHPVQGINWHDYVKWCNARSEKAGLTPVYCTDDLKTQVFRTGQMAEPSVRETANGYRVPTTIQWEYAARGGFANRRFPWGSEIQHGLANYYSSVASSYDTSPTRGYHPMYQLGPEPYTSPAGSFPPNGYGLYDMVGNMWEWCYNPDGNMLLKRVMRGGSWHSSAEDCTFAYREGEDSGFPDSVWNYFVGFRAILPLSSVVGSGN